MSDSIVLTITDPIYGILSCNSKSKSFGGKTMTEYILDGVTKDNVSKSDPASFMKEADDSVREESIKGIPVPDDEFRIGGNLNIRAMNVLIKENILELYINIHADELGDSYNQLNTIERKLLSDELYMHMENNHLPDVSDAVKDFVMNGIIRTDGLTLQGYYDTKMGEIRTQYSEQIVTRMSKAIDMRLREPEFLNALALVDIADISGELPFVVPESEDVDALEQLNIHLLSKVRLLLRSRDIFVILDGSIATVRKILTAVMRLIAGTRNYIRSDKIAITDKFVQDVLKMAFPNCRDLILLESTLPSFVREQVTSTIGFEKVNPEIIWYYVQRYVASGNLKTMDTTKRDISTVFDKMTQIGDKIAPDNKQKMSQREILAQRRQRTLDAFSPTTMGKVTLYKMDGCRWCDKAEELLDSKKIPYEAVPFQSVSKEDLIRISKSKDGSLSFPIVVIGDKYIGGFTELQKMLKKKI
jgi:glutaredoxin